MRRSCLYLSAASLLATSGCTHLETTNDVTTGSRLEQAVTGMPYALPALHYELAVEHSVVACPQSFTLKFSDSEVTFWNDVKLQTKVSAEPHYVAGERFLADYRSLASFLKTTSYGLETYPSGALKSLNVSADDQSGPLIRDIVSVGLSVAGLIGSPASHFAPKGQTNTYDFTAAMNESAKSSRRSDWDLALDALTAAAPVRNFPACRSNLEGARKERAAAADAVLGATAALEKSNRQVARFSLIAASDHAVHDDLANLDKALAEQAVIADGLDDAQARLQKAAATLVVPDTLGFTATASGIAAPLAPNDPGRFNQILYVRSGRALGLASFRAWWKDLSPAVKAQVRANYTDFATAYGVKDADPPDEPTLPGDPITCVSDSVAACVAPALTLYASLTSVADPNPAPDALPSTVVTTSAMRPAPGLFVRSQQLADFRLCLGKSDVEHCPSDRLLVNLRGVPAPQLGQLRFLPFSNRMFEASKLSVAMREDGSVESFNYDRTKALASGAAAAAKDAITQYEAYRDKRDKKAIDDVAAQRAEEIASVQHQIDVLTKQKELIKAQTPDANEAVKDETAMIAANVALLEAKLAQLKAEAALAQGASGS